MAGVTIPYTGEADPKAATESKSSEDWFAMHLHMSTDHQSYDDVPFISPVLFKKAYRTKNSNLPVLQFAHEATRFAAVHVHKNRHL